MPILGGARIFLGRALHGYSDKEVCNGRASCESPCLLAAESITGTQKVHLTQLDYLPLTLPSFSLLVGIFLAAVILIELGLLRYAYIHLGMNARSAMFLLLGSLIGSYFNIPIAQMPAEQVISNQQVWYFGVHYVVPLVVDWPGTMIAINVGGALIPSIMSFYLLVKYRLWIPGIVITIIVAGICHALAHPIAGVGIAEPIIVPAIAAGVGALVLCRRHPAPAAYIGGSLGTLIGADLLNLSKIHGLGAPVASIGGAGTFDGIFLIGIVAVLIASISRPLQAAEDSAAPPD
jgi:uncharacterized membrane protein